MRTRGQGARCHDERRRLRRRRGVHHPRVRVPRRRPPQILGLVWQAPQDDRHGVRALTPGDRHHGARRHEALRIRRGIVTSLETDILGGTVVWLRKRAGRTTTTRTSTWVLRRTSRRGRSSRRATSSASSVTPATRRAARHASRCQIHPDGGAPVNPYPLLKVADALRPRKPPPTGRAALVACGGHRHRRDGRRTLRSRRAVRGGREVLRGLSAVARDHNRAVASPDRGRRRPRACARSVDLRGRLGPFARSKRLRMVRTIWPDPAHARPLRAPGARRSPALALGPHRRGRAD